MTFPHYTQLDTMDCGPTSLRIIAQYYGKHYSLQTLREKCHISREGVSMLGISDAAEEIGFRTISVKLTWAQLRSVVPLPCIVHWYQRHFIVVYKIRKQKGKWWVYVSDPANGLLKYSEADFLRGWRASTTKVDKEQERELEEGVEYEALKIEELAGQNKKEDAETEETKNETTEGTDAAENSEQTEKEKTTVYYVTDEQQQSQYINMFKEQGQDAILLTHNIDSAFVTYLEQKHEDVRFLRIDADVHESLKDEVAEDEKESFGKMADSLVEIFRKELNDDKLDVKVEKLKDDKVASMAVLSEENRRMEEMMKMYGMSGMDSAMFGSKATLVLNANHPLVKFLTENKESENVTVICKQLYDLAMLAHKPLSAQEMTDFVARSNEIMMLLTK